MFTDFLQNCIDGLMIGSGYALLALGFTMVFGVMKRINLSYGPSITVSYTHLRAHETREDRVLRGVG